MLQSKSTGFVIKVKNFGEADRIYTLLTKEKGKLSVLAKGVRKIKSKRSGSLDLLNQVKFSYDSKYAIPVLTEVSLVSSFEKIKKDLNKIKSAYIVLELIDKFLQEEDANDVAYNLLNGALKTLCDVSEENSELMLCYFELKLMDCLGFTPDINSCTECGKAYSDSWSQVRFSYENGGLVCSDHSFGHLISTKQVDIIKDVLSGKFSSVIDTYSGQKITQTEELIRGYIEYTLSGKIRSAGFKFNQDLMSL